MLSNSTTYNATMVPLQRYRQFMFPIIVSRIAHPSFLKKIHQGKTVIALNSCNCQKSSLVMIKMLVVMSTIANAKIQHNYKK